MKTKLQHNTKIDHKLIMLLIIIIVFSTIITIFNPRFLRYENITNILFQYSVVGIMAIGMTMVIITGGIDLSVGYGITTGAIICGVVFIYTENPILSIIAAITVTTILGLINGFLISIVRITPFVATLATMSLMQGLLNLAGQGQRIMLRHAVFDFIGKTSFLGISISTYIMALAYIIGMIVLNYTKLGSYIYAIGSNEKNAGLAGINTTKYKLIVYAISGFMMGISAVLLGSKLTLVTQSSGGQNILMDTIAAVIIGGTSLSGGSGKLTGTLAGVVLLGIISNTLTLLNVPGIAQDFFRGIVIILALLINVIPPKIKIKIAK